MVRCDECGSTNINVQVAGFIRFYDCNNCGNHWDEIDMGDCDDEEDDD